MKCLPLYLLLLPLAVSPHNSIFITDASYDYPLSLRGQYILSRPTFSGTTTPWTHIRMSPAVMKIAAFHRETALMIVSLSSASASRTMNPSITYLMILSVALGASVVVLCHGQLFPSRCSTLTTLSHLLT